MWGLTLVGLCLMLGPVHAAGGPGRGGVPAHVLPEHAALARACRWARRPRGITYVNKNLIELLACLVLACTPTGLWLGLDALLFGRRAGARPAPRPPRPPAGSAAGPDRRRGRRRPERAGGPASNRHDRDSNHPAHPSDTSSTARPGVNPMALLTPEQRALGRENANTALGVTRRDFLKAAAVAPALGAFYFGYTGIDKPPVKAAIIGTGNEGCQAMIRDHNRDVPRLHRLLRHPPSASAAGRQGVRQPQGLQPGRRQEAQASTTTSRRCSPTRTSRWSSSPCPSGCTPRWPSRR